ncbi:endonuclease toxin domain-containing protein [Afifella pfennigii]|uniref:endonuclease toxin domain-containing protein n=1 Tax=Afifella pfennigii TaxID=209897 RepID=UPI00047DC02C|nr:minor capsid protein [Afifella pfennigii]
MLKVHPELLDLRAEMAAARLFLAAQKAGERAREEGFRAHGLVGAARLRARFRARLNAAIHLNAAMLAAALPDFLGRRLRPADLADVGAEREAALAEWERRLLAIAARLAGEPERLQEARRLMEEALLRRFSGQINALRQQALGIDRYVWRSRDDDKVRPLHARHDDKIFAWDEPPEEGHPGEAYNCRCWAEPYVEEEAPQEPPDTGIGHHLRLAGATADGVVEAARDFALDALGAIPEQLPRILVLPELARLLGEYGLPASRYGYLLGREILGELAGGERAELDAFHDAIRGRAAAIIAFFQDAPELARALGAYFLALQRRPALLGGAYRQGLASEEELRAAHRERAYVDTLILLNAAPWLFPSRILWRAGRGDDAGDAKKTKEELEELAAELRRDPADVDWPVIDNPGIVWGRGIKAQGIPWEDALEATGEFGRRLPANFKTIDFFEPATGMATSAKTLDTRALGYATHPTRVYGVVKRYVDEIARFRGNIVSTRHLTQGKIASRKIELAVPEDTAKDRVIQLRRALRYAEGLGVELRVSFINEP